MKKQIPFDQLIKNEIFDDPLWLGYFRDQNPMPEKPSSAIFKVRYFLYLGAHKHAQEVSYKTSLYLESLAVDQFKHMFVTTGIQTLFESALYRSIAQRQTEAASLWHDLVQKRRSLPDKQLYDEHSAHLWIFEAYALLKLERYDEIRLPANKGLDGLLKGKATFSAPHNNSREYGLVDVMIALADYHINSTAEKVIEINKALYAYKQENLIYGRLGYDVIFDLQMSYPGIIKIILPGQDPQQD